ncbi:MAG: L-serine ammonia-lyase, iron-sulfur-dependent, subunit alpha [Johnsonella sp.]|nr:L-serine ammonia-lyase, iron-sulfur-dependent, subunit alpha [Johnsonella sp.]
MVRTDEVYQKCISILKEELLPAMGCTEPIAIAYAAAKAREVLGAVPDKVLLEASGNIIKNVKSVVVPNTGHMRGIYAAVAAGIIAGDANKKLEVISKVSPEKIEEIKAYLDKAKIKVDLADSDFIFDIVITVYKDGNHAKVRIVDNHTNIVLVMKGDEVLLSKETGEDKPNNFTDRSFLSVEKILDFVDSVEIEDIEELLERQIEYNMAIAEEGLKNDYGANIGSVLLSANKEILEKEGDAARKLKARAMAAAGSDARMNGCELPVIINSGSGNQGITVSVPVVVYAREMGVEKDKMYRALALSNLLAIHQKTPIGRLSAYCGVVNAGVAAGCGIAYLKGGGFKEIAHTLVNGLAIASGIICDGAKASCAAKIGLAVENGILGYEMYCRGQQFVGGDGIVKKGVENMIASVGRLGREGMRETDKEILKIMLDI